MIDPSEYSIAAQVLSLKMTGQVGPRTFELLMTRFDTVADILLSEEDTLLELPGIGPSRSEAIGNAHTNLDKARAIIENLEAIEAKVTTCLDSDFPAILHELNDPPLLLFYQGRLPDEDEKRVAVIGSQDVSAEGIGDAVELSKKLSGEGIAIVGGLARGIDTAGHMGALRNDGSTFALLPSGFNHIHPVENAMMAREITRKGGLISEYLPGTPVNSGRLMSRNRLIIGLSQAVIIGEVSADSVGTLDAALCCHQLGKLLFVIIGRHNNHYEKLAGYGAIPLKSVDEYRLIVRSLV